MSDSAKYYNLTHSQRGIWYTEKLYPGTSINNIAATLKLKGCIDPKVLEKAVLAVIEKNDAFRIRLAEIDGEIYQYVSPDFPDRLDFFDFSKLDISEVYNWDEQITLEPLELFGCPLVYFAILKVSDTETGVYFKAHHLVADGWSSVHASNEIVRYYNMLMNGEDISDDRKPSFIESLVNEKEYETSPKFLKDKDFWESKFDSVPEPTTLKSSRNLRRGTKARRKKFSLPSRLNSKIFSYCKNNKTSVFALFLSTLAIYINRVTGSRDIVIGVIVLNRSGVREKNTMGMYVSTIPLRIQIDETMSFADFSEKVLRDWYAALKHSRYPQDSLLKQIREKHKNFDKLYDIVLSYQNGKFIKNVVNYTQEARWHFAGHQSHSLYVHINDREDEENLLIDYDFLTDVFYAKEIDFVNDHMCRLLWHALDNPAKQLARIDMISEKEKRKVLYEFNLTEVHNSGSLPVHRLIECVAAGTPGKTAITFRGKTVTYSELNERTNKLAALLRKKGVGPDKIAGIMSRRSPEMLVAMIAVLKAGGAYLPVDPDYPEDRIRYMLEDSSASLLLTYEVDASQIDFSNEVIDIAKCDLAGFTGEDLPDTATPDNLAYIIYTSGSTGVPKGVMLKRKGLDNLVHPFSEILGAGEISNVLSITTMSFDIFIFETILPLAFGLNVVIADDNEQKIPLMTGNLIKDCHIDFLQTTPTRMQMLVNDPDCRHQLRFLKLMVLGGEPLLAALVEKISQLTNAEIYNGYGPTETTVYSTFQRVLAPYAVNIGKPAANTRIYILDRYLNPMPIGVPGEIFIGGDGVGKGYIGKPEMTAERFVQDPFDTSKVIYRTGDLGRWYPAGEIEYLGRADQQIKIRGLRIELGEIENVLLRYEGIVRAAVVDRKDRNGHAYICAFFEGDDGITPRDLRSYLMKSLPQYMIPSCFIHLDRLPLTPSRKVDKRMLPEVEYSSASEEVWAAPANDMERTLARLWENTLGFEKVGTTENFFEIGGDSLFAINLISRIYKDLSIEISLTDMFKYPTIKEMASYFSELKQGQATGMIGVEDRNYYPLSSQQKRLYILNRLESSVAVYNMPFALVMEGSLDKDRLELALNTILERHESLRTRIGLEGEEPVQLVEDEVKLPFDVLLSNNPQSSLDALAEGFIRPFDLSVAPLMRCRLVKCAKDRHVLFIDMHHIISDGTSINIFFRELIELYEGKNPAPPAYQYRDYAVRQEKTLKGDRIRRQKEYWHRKFEGELPVMNLPLDFPRPVEQSYKGDTYKFKIDPELFGRLKNIAAQNNATIFMLLLAAFNILLSKYSGQEDIIVGTPFTGRSHPEMEGIIGMFANIIALRDMPKGSKSFVQFLAEVRKHVTEAMENQDYPFEDLVSALGVQRTLDRNPLFDLVFAYNKQEGTEFAAGSLKFAPSALNAGISKFDLTLQIDESGQEVSGTMEYCSDLFKRQTIERMTGHYINLLAVIAEDPVSLISDISILSEAELELVLNSFNKTALPYEKEKTFQQLFEERVEKNPEAVALAFDGKELTYGRLNEQANRLARFLTNTGVGRDSIVGIMVHRSFEMLIGILAIFKAGAAYLPIDPDYPDERVNYILENSKADAVITEKSLSGKIQSLIKIVDVQDAAVKELHISNPGVFNHGEDLGYVIYTSGTTGNPKGVMLERKSLNNLVAAAPLMADFSTGRTIACISTFSFDIFVLEALIPLMTGARVVLANEEEQRNPRLLNRLILDRNVDILMATPARLEILIDSGYFDEALKRLSDIMLGGEVFSPSLFEKLRSRTETRIYNMYGPSEITVYSNFRRVSSLKDLNIGKPAANTRIYILDRYMKPVPPGIEGELYICGDGVGRGYVCDDEMTGTKFVTGLVAPERKMFRSGDYGKWTEDGNIVYTGRRDNQVKLRGLRIELEEIEHRLKKLKGVKKAVVLIRESQGRKYLCAYLETNTDLSLQAMREELSKTLPLYMVPSEIIKLDRLPLSLTGKVDRNVLLSMSAPDEENDVCPVALNPIEEKLVEVWSQVLNTRKLNINDSFFELGGDSLAVILTQTKLFKYGWNLTIQDFYKYQTIRKLADKIMAGIADPVEETAVISEDAFAPDIKNLPVPGGKVVVKNILLLGVTGFLGSHILDKLLVEPDIQVFCVIRGSSLYEGRKKLEKLLDFYFHGVHRDQIGTRVHLLMGDITQERLGLTEEQYFDLGRKTDAVINSAALVKHYGHYDIFDDTNVKGIENIIRFSAEFGKRLFHISTTSVCGEFDAKDNEKAGKIKYSEKDFYIGQDYSSNMYVKSKFISEKKVYEAIFRGNDAYVLRVGNLTGRFSDGKFQINIHENSFYGRLKALIHLNVLPESARDYPLEWTPVDYAGQAVKNIVLSSVHSGRVFHVYNQNYSNLGEFAEILRDLNYKVDFIDDRDFDKAVRDAMEKEDEHEKLTGLIPVLEKGLGKSENDKIELNNDDTCLWLKNNGFEWPEVDKKYFSMIISYMREAGFV